MGELIEFPDPYAADRQVAAEIFDQMTGEELVRFGLDPTDPQASKHFEACFLYAKHKDTPPRWEMLRLLKHTETADGGIWFNYVLEGNGNAVELVAVEDPELLKVLASSE